MKKKITITVSIIVLILLSVFIYKGTNGNKKQGIQVKTAKVQRGEIKSYLNTTAVIKSKNVKQYFGTQSKVIKVNVKVGDAVKKGDILVSYDLMDLKNTVKQAEIQYNNAILQQKDLKNQKKSIQDKKNELDSQINQIENSANKQDLAKLPEIKNAKNSIQDISEEKIKQAENSVELAKLNYESAKSKLSSMNENIVADFDGVVTDLNVVEGSMGNPAQPAVVVQALNNLKAVISLGKFDAAKIEIGQEAEVKIGENVVKGKVSFIDPVAKKDMGVTGSNVSLNAEIDLSAPAKNATIDFDVDANILLAKKENVLKVPAETLITDKAGKNIVYIVSDGKVQEKEVKTGIQSELEVEIKDGLNEGDKVILNPNASIKNGVMVKEASEEAK